MLRYRHDPLSRRLMITMLLIINVVAIREEYLEKGDLSWTNIVCFFVAVLAVCCMRGKKQQC
jgi:hypothetical protein